jgi:hypothetical protein
MTRLKQRALALTLAASLAPGFSCADDEPEKGPTEAEMRQVAVDACAQGIECGTIPDSVTLDECIENQVGTYQVSRECVAFYDYDECLTTLTCEEIDQLNHNIDIGSCVDERDETDKVQCVPP